MKIQEMRKKSEVELVALIKLLREMLRDLRFKVAARQHKDVRELRENKKDIARILTVLKEKKIISGFSQKPTTKESSIK